jgi:TatD DNase family protein
MRLIDVHGHLEWDSFSKNIDDVIMRSRENNIIAAITCSVYTTTIEQTLDLVKKNKGFLFATLGFAPSDYKKRSDTFTTYLEQTEKNAAKIVAVGEIGLDYYWIREPDIRKQCEDYFIQALALADKIKKPIVIHCRDAEKRTIELIEEYYQGDRIHMHCFSGDEKLISRCLKNGWWFSIPTSVINRKIHQTLASTVPLDRMMLETDAPFLSPIEGQKINEPKNIVLSARYIAKLKGVSIEEVADITTKNAIELFSLGL